MGEGGKLWNAFVWQCGASEFELFELCEVGGEFQARVVEFGAVRERDTLQAGDGLDGSDACGSIQTIAELQILQRQAGKVF